MLRFCTSVGVARQFVFFLKDWAAEHSELGRRWLQGGEFEASHLLFMVLGAIHEKCRVANDNLGSVGVGVGVVLVLYHYTCTIMVKLPLRL
jgi:hypothetical protein